MGTVILRGQVCHPVPDMSSLTAIDVPSARPGATCPCSPPRCAIEAVDPGAHGRRGPQAPKAEGLRIAERLNELGVDVYCAHAETGAMVEEIANRLSTGRLRVHDHLEEWFAGYRRYRRDDKGGSTRPTIT
jgi:hypothetical protein